MNQSHHLPIGIALLLLNFGSVQARNHVQNGAFTSGTSPWTLALANGATASLSVAGGSPTFGFIDITNPGTITAKACVQLKQTLAATLTSGTEYTISFKAKAGGANKTMDVILYSASNSMLFAQYNISIPSTPSDGQQFTYTYTAAADYAGTYLSFRMGGSTNPGDVYIRAVKLENKLTWAPPLLVNPETRTLTATSSVGTLTNTVDYIINLPAAVPRTAMVTINGGRNVVIVGGHVQVGLNQNFAAFVVKNGPPNRIVHIEGVLVTHTWSASAPLTSGQGDGVQIVDPEAIVQIQNFRCINLNGAYDDPPYNHTDFIQPYGGSQEVRVDGMTGSSNYQGLFLSGGTNQSFIFRNINMVANSEWFSGALGGYMIWLSTSVPTALSNVYVQPRPGRALNKTVYPDADATPTSNRPVVNGNYLTWPGLTTVTGGVYGGAPAGGDFVPGGPEDAGLGYVSPGYK